MALEEPVVNEKLPLQPPEGRSSMIPHEASSGRSCLDFIALLTDN